jgi:hypothetical protein
MCCHRLLGYSDVLSSSSRLILCVLFLVPALLVLVLHLYPLVYHASQLLSVPGVTAEKMEIHEDVTRKGAIQKVKSQGQGQGPGHGQGSGQGQGQVYAQPSSLKNTPLNTIEVVHKGIHP